MLQGRTMEKEGGGRKRKGNQRQEKEIKYKEDFAQRDHKAIGRNYCRVGLVQFGAPGLMGDQLRRTRKKH